MQNRKSVIKRILAYTIDTTLVIIVASLITSVPFFNKGMIEYQKTYKEYETEYAKYSEYINLFNESYKDEEITKEEYTELTKNSIYKEIIEIKYDDEKISQDEYDDIIDEVNTKFDTIAKDYIYILNKKGISNPIINLILTILYFGVLQYFLKGQTIGKKIFKLKVVSTNNKKLNVLTYILRTLIVNDVLLNTITILFLAFSSKGVYTKASDILSTLISVVEMAIIFLVLTREDERGLHDLLFNTKVISTKENDNKKDNKVIEVEQKEVQNGKRKK